MEDIKTSQQKLAVDKMVWILEKQESDLTFVKTKESDYILEGIAAIFGIENNNHRIYEEAEYLPHLDYLKAKIAKKGLLGELDHPEKFDVSLKNVSHIIESLDYDKASRQVKIRIKLLNRHPAGEMAKALADAGVPLRISSRAAGVVRENKKVQIKKIFTYDLVCESGFEEATLERINESVSTGLSHIKSNSLENQLENISESLGFEKSSGIRIYNVTEEKRDEFLKTIGEDKINNSNQEMANYVTVDELDSYSVLIKTEIDALREKIEGAPGLQKVEETIKLLESKVAQIEEYAKYLAENLDKTIAYSEYLAENVDQSIEYSKYLAENLDKSISYQEYLAENLDRNISYSEYLAENLDKGISFANYLAENLEKGIAYGEYLAENLDKSISYQEYLAENLDRNISYSEYLAENLDKTITYGDYLAENIDKGISYSEYVAEKLEKNILYSEYIAENVNSASVAPTAKMNESVDTNKEKVEKPAVVYEGLSSKIDALLESVKKQKTRTAANESQYHFFRFLSEGKRAEFDALDETKKQKVADALKDNAYFSEADITRKWDEALVEKIDVTPRYLSAMPEEFKGLYEALTPQEKESIHAQSVGFKLETDYQIKNFWQTRNLKKTKAIGYISLNEQEMVSKGPQVSEYISNIGEEIAKRFRK